jgi:hypothetical protein
MAGPYSGNNNNSLSGLLKRVYKDGLTKETYTNRPYWALMNKKQDTSQFVGSTFQYATEMNDIQARNVLFSGAQAQALGLTAYSANALTGTVAGAPNAGNVGVTQWTLSRVINYSYATISTELELSARDKKGAFEEAVVMIHDSALNVLGNDQEISLFGGSVTSTGVSTAATGFISAIGSTTNVASSTGKLTLQYNFDAAKFSQGQELDLYYNNSGTITKRNNTSAGVGLFVGNVDFVNGVLTIVNSSGSAIAINTIFTDAAVGDFICVSNDFNYGASTGTQGQSKINGFESYVPFGGPVADSPSNLFNGVNRNIGNIARNAGTWVDATGAIGPNAGTALNIEDAIIAMMTYQQMVSDKQIDTFALNHNQNARLLKSNISRTLLPGGALQTDVPELSFKAVEVETGFGSALVMPSRFCGTNRIYGLHMDSWVFVHLGGEPVNVNSLDGNDWLREAALDAKSQRYFSLGNVVCTNPGAQSVCNIAP